VSTQAADFKEQLNEHLRELHLPAIRHCFEAQPFVIGSLPYKFPYLIRGGPGVN
jgi:hypothetical protein